MHCEQKNSISIFSIAIKMKSKIIATFSGCIKIEQFSVVIGKVQGTLIITNVHAQKKKITIFRFSKQYKAN